MGRNRGRYVCRRIPVVERARTATSDSVEKLGKLRLPPVVADCLSGEAPPVAPVSAKPRALRLEGVCEPGIDSVTGVGDTD